MKLLAVILGVLLLMIGLSTAAPVLIPLEGVEGYSNSITMDVPFTVVDSSGAFDTEHVYKITIKGERSTFIFVFLKSFGATRPTDTLNVSANTNIQTFQSQNMHLVSDVVAENKNYGLYRDQEFGWADGSYMFVRTFMLDKKHVVFVMSPFDKATTTTMFDSIVPGTDNSMFKV
jgi:hypothetical protein